MRRCFTENFSLQILENGVDEREGLPPTDPTAAHGHSDYILLLGVFPMPPSLP